MQQQASPKIDDDDDDKRCCTFKTRDLVRTGMFVCVCVFSYGVNCVLQESLVTLMRQLFQ